LSAQIALGNIEMSKRKNIRIRMLFTALAVEAVAQALAGHAMALTFTPGDLVIDTVSNSTTLSNAAALDTAAPIVLQQFNLNASGTSATSNGSLTLPQINNGLNSAISGEYGSASEGILQRSVNGQYLTIMGYGVSTATFNAQTLNYGTAALGQTTSLTQAPGSLVVTVPRVVALIGANGSVNTTTALTGVFNTNNPRSVITVNGTTFYVSGQGASKTDSTQGVFVANLGATTATPIDNSTDTRVVPSGMRLEFGMAYSRVT
jgi:hypothetical protein